MQMGKRERQEKAWRICSEIRRQADDWIDARIDDAWIETHIDHPSLQQWAQHRKEWLETMHQRRPRFGQKHPILVAFIFSVTLTLIGAAFMFTRLEPGLLILVFLMFWLCLAENQPSGRELLREHEEGPETEHRVRPRFDQKHPVFMTFIYSVALTLIGAVFIFTGLQAGLLIFIFLMFWFCLAVNEPSGREVKREHEEAVRKGLRELDGERREIARRIWKEEHWARSPAQLARRTGLHQG